MNVSYDFEKNLVGYCGVYCRDCVCYRNIFKGRAQDLLDDIEKSEWIKMVWENLNAPFGVDQFLAGLKWLASSPGCLGCRAGAGWPDCPVRTCAQAKKVRGCYECEEYPCPTVSVEEAAHQRELTETVRTLGLEEYIKAKRGGM